MGEETEWEGRLEVCLSQRWGSVSSRASDGWPADNAQVVCRDLGYGTSNTSTSMSYHKYFLDFKSYETKISHVKFQLVKLSIVILFCVTYSIF